MLAMVIVGVGVVALMQAITSATMADSAATRSEVAINLARNIHEYALDHDISAVDPLDGKTFSPVIDSDGQPVADGYANWQQSVRVYKVIPSSGIQANVALTNSSTTRLRRVVVQVLYKGKMEYTQNWLVSPSGL
jgi:Tfp pilus assembly protein PilV